MIHLSKVRMIPGACVLLLAPPAAHELTQFDPSYGEVASQADRAAGKFGYEPFGDFPHLEVVDEGTGDPNPEFAPLVTDHKLNDLIGNGTFSSLQVRNFTPRYGDARLDGSDLVIPFGLSLKQYEYLLTSGTLNLSGTLRVPVAGGNPVATIERYDDSQLSERIGRLYWLHQRDNLKFARAVAEGILTDWLTKDPSRLERLKSRARAGAVPPRT